MADETTMNTGDISRRLGFTMSTEVILQLGFRPVGKDKRATLFPQSTWPLMCDALSEYILSRKVVPMQPKPAPARKTVAPAVATTAAAAVEDDDEL